jgi:hypothetical protein
MAVLVRGVLGEKPGHCFTDSIGRIAYYKKFTRKNQENLTAFTNYALSVKTDLLLQFRYICLDLCSALAIYACVLPSREQLD